MKDLVYERAKRYPPRYANKRTGLFCWPTIEEKQAYENLPIGIGTEFNKAQKRRNNWIFAHRVHRKTTESLPPASICFPNCNPVLASRADVYFGNTSHLIMLEKNPSHPEDSLRIYKKCTKNLPRNLEILNSIAEESDFANNEVCGSLHNIDIFSAQFINLRSKNWTNEFASKIPEIGIWDLDLFNFGRPEIERASAFIKDCSGNEIVVRVTMFLRGGSIKRRVHLLKQEITEPWFLNGKKLKTFKLIDQLAIRHETQTTGGDPFVWQGVFRRE